MTTDLVLVEAIPALAEFNLSAEMQEKFEDIIYEMTVPPEGLNDPNWKWRPDVMKIKTPTTSDDSCPGNAAIGDLWASGEIIWSRKQDGYDNPFLFVPIYQWTQHSMFPYGASRPACSSPDGKTAYNGTPCKECPHLPWEGTAKLRPGSDKTACDRSTSFLVVAADMSGIYELHFRGTSASAGNVITKNTKRCLWRKTFALTTVEQKGDANTWQKYDVAPMSGVEVSPEIQAFARYVNGIKAAAAAAESAALAAKRAEVEAMLDGDGADIGNINSLEAEMNDDSGFSESM